MKLEHKNRSYAVAGTLLFHGIVALMLIFLALRTPLPLPGEEGVEVSLGNSEVGMGEEQPEVSQSAASLPPPAPPKAKAEEVVTQRIEESVTLPTRKETKVEPRKEPKPEPAKTTPPEPEPPKVDPRALYRASGNQTISGQSQGTSGQPGDQGNPNGTPSSSNNVGAGGAGDGISFSLQGRSALLLPKPGYDSREQGRVVVSIYVSREGLVTNAIGGARGTTITDPVLIRSAVDAARRARFSPNPDAPEEQIGTITYNFLRLN